MSDSFVDTLFARLDGERSEAQHKTTRATQSRERVTAGAGAWWDGFCQAVASTVTAWNAKDVIDAVVTCTRDASGSMMLWHPSVEAEFRLIETRVVMKGRIGNTRPRDTPFIDFNEARGMVLAVLVADGTVRSPTEAAEHMLGPIFTHAFNDAGAAATTAPAKDLVPER